MKRQVVLRAALVALLALGIGLGLAFRRHLTPEMLESFILGLGVWGPVIYMGIYIIATVFFLPGALVTLAGGALFGPIWGVAYVLVGSVTGATLAFLVARYVARDWVEQKATGILKRVLDGVEREGWLFLAFVRLMPLFPFNLLNYALGLSRIPLLVYVLGSAVFMLPGIAGYVYLGYLGREALVGGENLVQKIVIGLGVFSGLVLLPILVRRIMKRTAESA